MENISFNKLVVSQEQRNNLKDLKDLLLGMKSSNVIEFSEFEKSNVVSNNPLRVKFDITKYTQTKGSKKNYETKCKALGCGIGIMTHIIPKKVRESYGEYAERVFGIDDQVDLYIWCFDSGWYGVDGTKEGLAKRIEIALEYGIPENCSDMMIGKAPLPY